MFKDNKEFTILLFALPSLLGLIVFFVIPFIASIYLGMIDNPVGQNFVGLRHYIATINNRAFRLAFFNTVVFMLFSVGLGIVFSLSIAIMLRFIGNQASNNTHASLGIWGASKSILATFFILPLVVPSGSVVFFWHSVIGVNGTINRYFFYEEPVYWLATNWAFFIILVIFLWRSVGFSIVLFLAGLNLIPKEYYENATIEGAGPIRQFFSITLVYLIPTIFLVVILSILQSFRAFREIYLLTGPHPSNLNIYMLQHYLNNQFLNLNYQRMSAGSHIFILGIVVAVVGVIIIKRWAINND